MTGDLAKALIRARERIDQATRAAGRSGSQVQLMLAAKMQPMSKIRQALELGAMLVGQNRVQEMVQSAPELNDLPHQLHLIGPLQSNKINAALRLATCIETIADASLAKKLAQRAAERHPIDVMVQVNTSGEVTKAGCRPVEATDLAALVGALPGLRLTGFMTVGLNSPDAGAVLASYLALTQIRDQVLDSGEEGTDQATQLSMGMSGDLELAIKAGATIVRLGTAIFGPRNPMQ
ncbi:MAG: YggS family pyridoxal phosphate-dependent enzyme [Micrococcales bacterium]|nr:YggS family pyridoxal phosphate-dependent enzyme [Micrococcales bacterium]